MDFEKIIRTELEELLGKHGFKITKVDGCKIEFESPKLTLRFFYNRYEHVFSFWIKQQNSEVEFENWVEKFLNLKREATFGDATQEQIGTNWAKWVAQYFQENQRGFLDGNDDFFKELNSFSSKQSSDYTNNLHIRFIKRQIHEAWQQKDYQKLANLEISKLEGISQSEAKKVEIAKRKIKNTIDKTTF